MAVGAWDFFALIWNHPIISCLVLLLFTPALFPIVVYFSPLLISTALCAVALISMNMADSPETEDDPYLRRWQSEQVETEQAKPARQSWSQWVTQVEEKTRVWVDSKFTKGKHTQDDKFKWKVIHDNDDENEISIPSEPPILPPSGKPTKIKYGTPAEDDDREADDVRTKPHSGSEPSSTSKSEKEEEIQSASSVHALPDTASIIQPQKENKIIRAPAKDEVVDTSMTKVYVGTQSKPMSSGLHALAEEIQCTPATTPNQKAGPSSLDISNISTTQLLSKSRDGSEQEGDGSFKTPTISGERVAQRVVQDHTGHAPPSLEIAGPDGAPFPTAALLQHVAAFESAIAPLSLSDSSSSRDTMSETASTARSLPNTLMEPAAVVTDAILTAQLHGIDKVSPKKVGDPGSRPKILVSTDTMVASESEAPAVSDFPAAGIHVLIPVTARLPSMNEMVAEARMQKPEPSAYSIEKSRGVGGMETDSSFLDAQDGAVEESGAGVRKDGERPISSSSELPEFEIGRTSSTEVHTGEKLSVSGSEGLPEINTEGTQSCVATDSLDGNEVGDKSTDFEKVIFVDESSNTGSSAISGLQRAVVDGIKLLSEVAEKRDCGRKADAALDVLEHKQLVGSPDKKGKSNERVEDICGSATAHESLIVARVAISSNAFRAIQFQKSEEKGGEAFSEEKADFCCVDDTIKPLSDSYGSKQQDENPREETSEASGFSTGSVNASSLDRKKTDKDLKGEAEKPCAVPTSVGTAFQRSVVASPNVEKQRDGSTADLVEGRNFVGLATTSDANPSRRVDMELETAHEIFPQSCLSETYETVSGKKPIQPDTNQQRNRSLNKEDRRGGKGGVWSSASVDDEGARDSTASRNAWVKANNEEEYDEYMKEYLSLKKSSSMPSSSRQEGSARSGFVKIPVLGKASSLSEKEKRDDDLSDSEAVVPSRRNPWTKIQSVDSVEEITARLSKKYNPTWTKLTAREGAGTSRPVSALATIDAPKPIEPEIFAINSPRESLNSPVRKAVDSEKTDESAESYMSPMKKVFSAVRNVGNKDKEGSGRNGRAKTPERRGLSSVLNIKRERFTSPLKRVLKSEPEGGRRPGSGNVRKDKVVTTTSLAVLAEEEGGSAEKFKDRLITPLKKVFSAEPSGGKKPDMAQEVTPHGSPSFFRASPAQKQLPVRDEVAADVKFRERFILPLKKKFSSDSKEERKKGEPAGLTLQTPERSGPLTANDTPGDCTSDRIKSPEKKFSLSWTKKRAKDQSSALPHAQEDSNPGSIFETPRSPAISEKTTARLTSHEKSNSTPSAVIDETGYSTEEFRSPERNFFWPLLNQQEKKEKESSQPSKDKAGGVRTSSWWTRKRDRVVVEEATVAQAKQPTRDDARSSPERIIAGRSVDSGVDRITAAERNTSSLSLPKRREKDDQQPFLVQSSPSEERPSPARTHRREHSDTLPTRFRSHERRMSLSELGTPEKESTSGERMSSFDQSVSMLERMNLFDKSSTVRKPQHARQRSTDMTDLMPEAHLYKSRSATGSADHSQERGRNETLPFSGSRSDPEVNKLYRNLDSPSTSNAEIRITDKLKVPLEEVLSLLAAGDSSTRNSTVARESSSSEETSSSEEEWSSSSDDDEEEAAIPVQKIIQPVHSRKSHHFFNKGNRQLRNVDA